MSKKEIDYIEDVALLFKFAVINEKLDLIEAREIKKRLSKKLEGLKWLEK